MSIGQNQMSDKLSFYPAVILVLLLTRMDLKQP